MKFGIIGQVGSISHGLIGSGLEPIARAIDESAKAEFATLGIPTIDAYRAFWDHLDHPRIHILDMPAGARIDTLIDEAYQTMEPADVVIDTSPSYWCDTLRRYRRMRHRAIYYVDVAWIIRDGQPLLAVGGDAPAIDQARPFLEAYCPNFRHLGGPGIAHYAAVIDECVQGAIAQIQGEAALMMEAWPADADENIVKQLWPLLDRPGLGRAGWQIDDAVQLEAATPVLAQTAMQAIADALDEHRSTTPPPRVGPFQHPDEIM